MRFNGRAALPWAVLFGLLLPVVVPAGGATAQERPLVGVVRDAHSGAPINGVLVRAGAIELTTGPDGRFALPGLPAGARLRFERLGYAPLTLDAAGLTAEVRLAAEPVLLDALTVRSAREGALAAGTALAVQTVEAPALRSGGHTSLAEALHGVEGVAVSRVGSWGARPALRGLEGERVAILVDGSRVNRACAFGMDQGLAAIDPSTVARVEVLSGPGSALYGSGNVGGVINVVTRRGGGQAPFAGEVRAEASSAVPGGGLGATLRLRRTSFTAALSVDGASYADYESARAVVPNSSFRHGTADLRLGWEPTSASRLTFQAQLYEGRDIGWPSMGDASIPLQARRNFALDWGAQLGHGTLDAVAARAWVQRLDHDMLVRMGMSTTQQRSHSTTSGARLQLRLRPVRRAHADVGVELTEWAAENSRWTTRSGTTSPLEFRTWPGTHIRDAGAFAQAEVALHERVTASAGGRVDYAARSADDWPDSDEWIGTGNAGVRLALPAQLKVRLGVGWGYRLPDPTELFGLALRPDGFVYLGNAALSTERGRNLELGLSREGDVLYASLTLYRNELRDLIAPVLAPGDSIAGRPVRTWGNLDRARIDGVSASVRWRTATHLQLAGTASYTRGEDAESGAPLPRIAPLHGTVTVRLLPRGSESTALELEGEGAARQARVASGSAEAATPAHAVLNARMSVELAGTRLSAGVDNVLDHAYRAHLDPVTLLRPGRNFFLRISRSFGEL